MMRCYSCTDLGHTFIVPLSFVDSSFRVITYLFMPFDYKASRWGDSAPWDVSGLHALGFSIEDSLRLSS